MRVVIRADATPSIGTGHVMRCWALAEEFSEVGAQVTWQGEFSVPWVAEALRRAGWGLAGPAEHLLDESVISADVVVVDSYDLPGRYRQRLLDLDRTVVAIVDHHHRALGPSTFWVNPGPPLGLPPQAGLMDGVDFILIRREIRALAQMRRRYGPEEHVTFLLGGTDSLGLGAEVARVRLDRQIFAGPGPDIGGNVKWLPPGRELLEVAMRSKLVVSTASVSSWEMLHAGVPLAVMCAVDNQQANYDWMTSHGWARGIDPSRDMSAQVALTVAQLAEGRPVKAIVDGLGARRVVRSVLENSRLG